MQISSVIDLEIFEASNEITPIRERQSEINSVLAVRIKLAPLFLVKFNIYEAKKRCFESVRRDA